MQPRRIYPIRGSPQPRGSNAVLPQHYSAAGNPQFFP